MIEVSSTTVIEASPQAVWRVLTDFSQFHEWNPFIREAQGSTEIGSEVEVRVRPSLPVPLRFRAEILDCEDCRELHWYGQVLGPWFASGDHTFTLEELGPHRVRFVQRERFSGILPWLGRRLLVREAERGFEAMNRALAERAREEEAS